MNDNLYQSRDAKRARSAYIAQCAFDYFVSILVTDAFLAKLLTRIGISDSVIGIISSLISLCFLVQLLSILLMRYVENVKKTVIIYIAISQLLFLSIYFIPFVPVSITGKTSLVILCLMSAYIMQYLVAGLYFKWANSYVAPDKRGEYSSAKDMVSLLGGVIFTIIAGYVIDYYEGQNNLEKGFLFITITMFILAICNLSCLFLIKGENGKQRERNKNNLRHVIKYLLQNKGFIRMVILISLWEIGRYLTVGFLGTFKTTDLMLSVGLIQIINTIASLCRFVLSKPFGKYTDKTSYTVCFRTALVLMACAFAVNIFTTKQTWWCIIIFTLLYNVALAGINQNSFNMPYSYVKEEYLVQAIAVKNSVSGILGFFASLLGGYILEKTQKAGNVICGIPLHGQQLLSAISLIIIIGAIIYSKCVVEKQRVMLQ